MDLIETEFPGLLVIEPIVYRDKRGFFLESFNKKAFADKGLPTDFVQDNHAYSSGIGVVRGLHLQLPPHAQAKLVWVTRGAVSDVVVDLRKGSPTYKRSFRIELSAENFRRLFIPKGFAHGYETLTEENEFMYKVDAGYAPGSEAGIRWDDPELAISWKTGNPVLSDKDRELPLLAQFDSPFDF
ncbi:dTDP-4-dehydrorhamnose 3,5-epimerase [Maridesulfovibrio hydrothermalis]|uniref:dTDP-4-dehydrorhamnose 3,5-epimerase n=1 Tax=Maridesulfovibrio hydrothermalis AM13 = DSM 14728 TaxID=1121451 RepID=L0R5Z7_9BACT|nr:dTDP-4-dehydrorhamnose 3,5-epimerase [Maridesulfovibrio hydrothermalis]CCO22113.1 dTDP-4-dehydrorhamnose 3,5-epimerase [Maridesulfovibrio hydrothermalis AM13 = DSM 14728]